MERDRIEQFHRDAADFCENLKRALRRLEREPQNRDLVHQAFRFVHSLKSESQFLKLEELGAVAHEMEGVLEQIRQGSIPVDGESLGILFPMVAVFEEMLATVSGGVEQAASEEVDLTDFSRDGETRPAPLASSPASDRTSVPHFGEFERRLIQEARARGEHFYRLTCEIEDSAPLKYPKAYLVVNNLEVDTNVIRTVPSFETRDDEAFRVFDVYFTAAVEEEWIRESIDVDQIKSVEINEITFERLEETGTVAPARRLPVAARRGPSSVRVENGALDEIMRRLKKIDGTVQHLHRMGAAGELEAKLTDEIAELSEAVPAVVKLVGESRKAPISGELRNIPWLVQDLAGKLGKRVRVSLIGGETRVDRRLISMLSEPLVHLVRNAVDHGIELPAERTAIGKPATGTVVIAAIERGDELVLQVGDDGRGIVEAAIRARASELGIEGDELPIAVGAGVGPDGRSSEGLLDLLVRPGFSTRTQPTAVSGRGVGLDAINQKVRQTLGGELRLQSQEGKGSLFAISIPGAGSMMSLLMTRADKEMVGIPLRDVESVLEPDEESFIESPDGTLVFGSLPIRGAKGRVTRSGLPPDSYSLVVLHREGRRLGFLCDELLFERDVPERRLSTGVEAINGLRSATIGETEADFLLLDISAIE